MTGMTNLTADQYLNDITGFAPLLSTSRSRFLALLTAVGTDAGTGFTEVSTSGTAYARQQVAGAVAATASFTTASTTITITTNPGWVIPGMSVYDNTTGSAIGTVLTYVGTTLTLVAASLINSSGSADSIQFSAFSAASSSAPGVCTTIAAQTFATATGAGYGTVIAWSLMSDNSAISVTNLLFWDFLGNFNWLPFESTSVNTGAGPVVSAKGNGYSNADPVVATSEYGGTLPTLTTGVLTGYNVAFVANAATDSLTLVTTSGGGTAFAATSTGSGMIRKITQVAIGTGIGPTTFSAGNFNMSLA